MADENKEKTRDSKGRFVPGYTPPTAWQPGQIPNPTGRPVNEHSITYWYRKLLAEVNGSGKTNAEEITRIVLDMAKAGEDWAIKEMADRTEGKPKQSIDAEITQHRIIIDDGDN